MTRSTHLFESDVTFDHWRYWWLVNILEIVVSRVWLNWFADVGPFSQNCQQKQKSPTTSTDHDSKWHLLSHLVALFSWGHACHSSSSSVPSLDSWMLLCTFGRCLVSSHSMIDYSAPIYRLSTCHEWSLDCSHRLRHLICLRWFGWACRGCEACFHYTIGHSLCEFSHWMHVLVAGRDWCF